jgi:hypothetical protein
MLKNVSYVQNFLICNIFIQNFLFCNTNLRIEKKAMLENVSYDRHILVFIHVHVYVVV